MCIRKFKLFLFDLGNVIVDFDHRIAAKKLSPFSKKTAEEIYEEFFDSKLTRLFEEGKITPLNFFKEIKKRLKLNISYRDFLPIWNQIFFLTPKNLKVYNLIKVIRKKYPVFLISNINVLHFNYLKKRFPIFEVFDKLLLSYRLKVRKPHHKIYEQARKKIGTSYKNILYIDDRKDLIQQAKKLGIQAIQFKGYESLRKRLNHLGISVD